MATRGERRPGKRKKKREKEKRVFKKPLPRWKVELREIEEVSARYDDLKSEEVNKFADLPLSEHTQEGLKAAGYSNPTEIQREAIPLALKGNDVLGAAKTGSGKTLAFLIPILETLWRERWTPTDGMGALVISPTRELAYQTFEVLRRVGRFHDFSAGLVIGGKDVKMERERIQRTNIIVCTPGRLLQHMDETPNFECSSLKILVLDEADRILDLGFERVMNSIIENLPVERQTLLFSATQTKSVHDLARLSLTDPQYVAVHEHSKSSTPHRLTQSYIVCELPEKLDTLQSFIKSHLQCKTIVFMSSCKQVKYLYEALRRLRPGIPLMALYGRQKQLKRVGIYNDFCQKKAAALFCTDIAARGLDFPAVHWVVQLDCPEDANTYIHRVGRTARYEKDGKALLFLLPSEEEGMLEALQAKKIPITQIRVNPKKTSSIQKKLQTFCAQDPELKHWAQKSFICYLRSVHLQSNKKIFNVHKLPIAEYASSLGLAQPPRVRFLRRAERTGGKTDSRSKKEEQNLDESEDEDHTSMLSEDEDEDVLKVKRVIEPSDWDKEELEDAFPKSQPDSKGLLSKVALAKKVLHKKLKVNTHVRFDEDGEPVVGDEYPEKEESDAEPLPGEAIEPIPIDKLSEETEKQLGGIDIEESQRTLKSRDKVDRKRERERVKAMHMEKKEKRRKHKLAADSSATGRAALVSLELESGSSEEESGPCGTQKEVSSEEEIEIPAPKRLRTVRKSVSPRTKKADLLAQDEELALHLLS